MMIKCCFGDLLVIKIKQIFSRLFSFALNVKSQHNITNHGPEFICIDHQAKMRNRDVRQPAGLGGQKQCS